MIFILFILLLPFIALAMRLVYLIGFHGAEYKLLAVQKQTKSIDLAPTRGTIVDRNGSELALNESAYRIDADLSVLKKYLKDNEIPEVQIISKLSQVLKMDEEKLKKIIDSVDSTGKPLQFVSLKRKAEKETVDAVKGLKLRGMIISSDTKRIYPNGNFLAQVLGHTDMNGNGISGVELSYDSKLHGEQGLKSVVTDAYNNDLPFSEAIVVQPIEGKSIRLTIDERIQELAERVAKETLEENGAKSVSITIMDPKTGEILALTNYPSYDPNDPGAGAKNSKDMQEMWKNRAISNIFEPGSIFKVVTSAAALNYESIKGGEKFVCKGSMNVTGINLKCDEPHGVQSFSDIIKNSCNVGFIRLSERIGKDNFYNYVKLLNFGRKTGIDLPGENGGIVRGTKDISNVDFATNSYGQGVAVNQVQFLAAFNAVANGGTWIRPHVMKEIYHMKDDIRLVDEVFSNYGARTVLSKEKSSELRTYLEKVVEDGTAASARIDGYRIAGKTGTANKVNVANGGYEQGKYVSSFAGMAPANDPKVTLIVTIEEPNPQKYFAAQTAVPAAKKLFAELFTILKIPAE